MSLSACEKEKANFSIYLPYILVKSSYRKDAVESKNAELQLQVKHLSAREEAAKLYFECVVFILKALPNFMTCIDVYAAHTCTSDIIQGEICCTVTNTRFVCTEIVVRFFRSILQLHMLLVQLRTVPYVVKAFGVIINFVP